jgi:hypothetical protein
MLILVFRSLTVIKEDVEQLGDLFAVHDGQQLRDLFGQLQLRNSQQWQLTRSSDPPGGGVETAPGLK